MRLYGVTCRFFWVIALAALVSTSSNAKCVYRPDIQADVVVDSCAAVTFGPSNMRLSFGVSEVDLGNSSPVYKAGSSFSGTFLSATVKKSHVVPHDPMSLPHDWLRLWTPGQMRALFVAKPPSEACPKFLFTTLTVMTAETCCDLLPFVDQCLVPSAVTRVVIISK
jgi:hypothetical protein